MRATMSGVIRVGAVAFGVKAFALVSNQDPTFHWLHTPCGAKLANGAQFCPQCDAPVGEDQRVKGAEYNGHWVRITQEELESQKSQDDSKNIVIKLFADCSQINPMWVDKTYHLVPAGPEDSRAYAVLSRAMRKNRMAVVEYTFYNAERLGIIWPGPDGLVLQSLHYVTHLKKLADYNHVVEDLDLTKDELVLAGKLVDQMSLKFEYTKIEDPMTARLWGLIQAKDKDKKPPKQVIHQLPPPPKAANLVELLQQSLKEAQKRKKTA